MRVQIVQHHADPLGRRVVPIRQFPQGFGPLRGRAPRGDPHLAPAGERLRKQKQMGHTVPLVLILLAPWLTRFGGQRNSCFADELFTGFIQTEDRVSRSGWALLDRQHVFPRGHQLGTVLGRNRLILLPVRLQLVFWSV
jgi:hypothetical protein